MKHKELENIEADDLTDEEAQQVATKIAHLAGVEPLDDDDTKLKKIVDFIHEHHLVPTPKHTPEKTKARLESLMSFPDGWECGAGQRKLSEQEIRLLYDVLLFVARNRQQTDDFTQWLIEHKA